MNTSVFLVNVKPPRSDSEFELSFKAQGELSRWMSGERKLQEHSSVEIRRCKGCAGSTGQEGANWGTENLIRDGARKVGRDQIMPCQPR